MSHSELKKCSRLTGGTCTSQQHETSSTLDLARVRLRRQRTPYCNVVKIKPFLYFIPRKSLVWGC